MELKNSIELKHLELKPIIETFIEYIKNIIEKNYKNNENKLRNYNESSEKEAIDNYNNELYELNYILYEELSKNALINEIIWEENDRNGITESDDFINELLDDYYSLFIYNNIINSKDFLVQKNITNDYLENLKELLKYIVYLKYENHVIGETISLEDLAKILNWVQSYSYEIKIILQMFSKINTIILDLFHLIENIIESKTIKYKISSINDKPTSIVNKVFFLIIESILSTITSNENIYISLKDNKNKISTLMQINKEILDYSNKLEESLHLCSKYKFTLEEIIEINECFILNKIDISKNIINVIHFFSQEIIYISECDENELINNFNNLYNFLENSIGKNENFSKVMSKIFINECNKVTFNNYT